MDKKTLYKLSSAVLLVALFTHPVFASEINELKDNSSEIQKSQDELALIKDNDSLSDKEKLILELDARKKIVIQALSLSMEEIKSIEENFKNLPNFDENSKEAKLKSSFITKLEEFKEYYSAKTTLIETSDELDIEGIKTIAKEIIDYRDAIYNPVIKEMVNFNLFFYTKDTIKTANTRIEKIFSDFAKIEKTAKLEIESFKEDLNRAKKLITEAELLNNQAGEKIFAQYIAEKIEETDLINGESTEINEEETVETTEITDKTEEPTEAINETEVVNEVDTNTLIIESLNKIREAYGVFLEISIDLRKSLDSNIAQ